MVRSRPVSGRVLTGLSLHKLIRTWYGGHMLDPDRRRGGESDGHRELAAADTARPASNGARRPGSAPAVEVARPQPFAVDVQRRNDVAIVQPHGELDLATVETLRHALDGIESPRRLVLDLRGLSFIDSTG